MISIGRHEVSLWLEITKLDALGRAIDKLRMKSRSFLKNWRALMEAGYNRPNTAALVTFEGVTDSFSLTDTNQEKLSASDGVPYYGIMAGGGNNPVDINDYILQSPLGDGRGTATGDTPNFNILRKDTASSKTSTGSLVIPIGGDYPVGSTVFVAIAFPYSLSITSITDSKGNSYTGYLTSAGGVTVRSELAYAVVTTALQSGDSITINHGGTNVALAAIAICATGLMNGHWDRGVTYSSGATTNLVLTNTVYQTRAMPQDVLFAVFGVNNDVSTTFTIQPSSGLTLIDKVGTTGGSGTSNFFVAFCYRVVNDFKHYYMLSEVVATLSVSSVYGSCFGMHKLAVPALNYAVMQFTSPVVSGNSISWEMYRLLKNTCGRDVTLKEFGVSVSGKGLQSSGGSRYMIVRDTISTPIVLPDQQSVSVKYVYQITV